MHETASLKDEIDLLRSVTRKLFMQLNTRTMVEYSHKEWRALERAQGRNPK